MADNSPAAIVARAAALLASDPGQARREAEAILRLAPNDPRALLILGSARRRLGDAPGARALLAPLAAAYPRAANTQYELGLTLADLGEGRRRRGGAARRRRPQPRPRRGLARARRPELQGRRRRRRGGGLRRAPPRRRHRPGPEGPGRGPVRRSRGRGGDPVARPPHPPSGRRSGHTHAGRGLPAPGAATATPRSCSPGAGAGAAPRRLPLRLRQRPVPPTEGERSPGRGGAPAGVRAQRPRLSEPLRPPASPWWARMRG